MVILVVAIWTNSNSRKFHIFVSERILVDKFSLLFHAVGRVKVADCAIDELVLMLTALMRRAHCTCFSHYEQVFLNF